MTNFGRKLEIFIIVVIIAVIGIVYAFKKPAIAPVTQTSQDQQSQPSNSTSLNPNATGTQPQQQVPTTIIEYKGQDGKTAFELLKAAHRVEATHSAFGDFVTGIDGIAPDSKHFWAFYVNGQFSQVGASTYVTKSTDSIKWQIDAIVDTTK